MLLITGSGYNSNDEGLEGFEPDARQKAYQVEYNVLSCTHLKNKQDKEVSQVSIILGKWDKLIC